MGLKLHQSHDWLSDAQELAEMIYELRRAEALVKRLRTQELTEAELRVKEKRAIIGRWLRRRGCYKVPWS